MGVIVTARLLTSRTGTDREAVVRAASESSSGDEIDAWSSRVEPGGAVGLMVKRTVADAPGSRSPRTAVMVPVAKVGWLPALEDAETNVAPDGITSLTVTAEAESGPWLVAFSV